MGENKQHNNNRDREERISRKQAIKKVGYAAFSAATMMLLLNNPAKGQGDNRSNPDSQGFDDFEDW